jgi:hypothetical protein
MTARKERILKIEIGNTRSLSVENSLCKKAYNCRKTDSGLNEWP